MNSLERVLAAVRFEPTDRVPVIAQVFGHTAVVGGRTLHDYVRSGEQVADCQIKALERYGYDAVFAAMDLNVETEALGSSIVYRRDDYPYVSVHAFSKSTDLKSVLLPDPRTAGRMPEILRAVKILRTEVGDDALVVGSVAGPMTLASQLLGLETALYLAIDEPATFENFLDFTTEVAIRFGVAQIEAGAHVPLVFNPTASEAVIPAGFFREMELPRLKRVFSAFAAAGASAGWLHVAGPITSILPFLAESGADIINFDYVVSPEDFMDKAPSLCGNGNVKSLDFEEADPESILAESLMLLDRFAARGGFILSSGCEIPPRSRAENVAALVSAVKGQG